MNEEEFERLSAEDQERIFHQTPFRERGELLLHSHNPLKLVHSLSQEELYLLTREMDLEERCEVLRYANLPQLFFISDIDCWKRDRLHPRKFLEWLETLLRSDEAKLLAWLVEMDYETLVSGFGHLIRVIKPEWEYPTDEVLGDQPYFTLDERYFISVKQENVETVRRVIEILFENHRGRYAALLEGVLGELEYEMEEEAYQKRTTRLSERGFPDPEIAFRIYRPLDREAFERFPLKSPRAGGDPETRPNLPPHYLALWSKERFFLDEVLLLFREESQEAREALEEELAWLSNKVIACDGIGFASEERVRRGIERARRFVSLGLEKLSEGDLGRARQLLKERWLETIFRFGVGALVEVRDAARQTMDSYWLGEREVFLEFLDDPYGSTFRGLLQNIPEYYDERVKDHPDQLRDFKDLREVERARRAVSQIRSIHGFLRREFPTRLAALYVEAKRALEIPPLFSVLGTVFASYIVNDKGSGSLSPAAFREFLNKGFEGGVGHRRLRAPAKERFLASYSSSEERELVSPLWALVFERVEGELKRIDPTQEVDSRFVRILCLAEAGKRKRGKVGHTFRQKTWRVRRDLWRKV